MATATISPPDQAADLLHSFSLDPETMAKVSDTGNKCGGNSNGLLHPSSVEATKSGKGLNKSYHKSAPSSYYGSYYPPTYQYPRYSYDKTNNNTLQYPYLGRSGSYGGYMDYMYSMYGPYYGYDSSYGYNTFKQTPNWFNGYKTTRRYDGGKENAEWLNELNKGPRAKGFKIGQQASHPETSLPDSEDYNKEDFFSEATNFSHAKLFVIKSYSEDDIHKSIKYNVWSSTPSGNKKLSAAYNEAKENSNVPIFLIFSVNTSGQFVGLAEMVGAVDFNKTVEYWQQDKWIGCFPVKWHIVKDIPNSSLRHITLDNNDNKPVTNSRDTQEVKLEQGVKVIKIFKEHVSKTCILDDFVFYESREKIIKEGKKKHHLYKKQQALAANDKIKDEPKETTTSMKPEVEEMSQNGVAEVASAC